MLMQPRWCLKANNYKFIHFNSFVQYKSNSANTQSNPVYFDSSELIKLKISYLMDFLSIAKSIQKKISKKLH